MANDPKDIGDVLADAFVNPEASLFIRKVLEKALDGGPELGARDLAHGWALLANVLMNDHLNGWNPGGDLVKKADDAVRRAFDKDRELPYAHHAQGLVHRANGEHEKARGTFHKAVDKDRGFARAQAQLGNQKVLLGEEKDSHGHFLNARSLNPHHPASGYFDWGEGRAYFQIAAAAEEPDWAPAIELLNKSVHALPTVWYNRLYLACAQAAAGDAINKAAAQQTMQDFRSTPGMPTLTQVKTWLQPRAGEPESVGKARNAVLQFIQKF
jgi:tetratricopeptide (TPR) repeat protein